MSNRAITDCLVRLRKKLADVMAEVLLLEKTVIKNITDKHSDEANIIRESTENLSTAFEPDDTWYVFDVSHVKKALMDYRSELISMGTKPEASELIIAGIKHFLQSKSVSDRKMVNK
ncbi:MAG: hypothetical protein FVQ79_00540 [Planctomycetes bacterium]|nr:hypothetical protein [Planctomycetota bacterium]